LVVRQSLAEWAYFDERAARANERVGVTGMCDPYQHRSGPLQVRALPVGLLPHELIVHSLQGIEA
jgi:hypothetical protein